MSQYTSNGGVPEASKGKEPIAIVGIGCRYPGGIHGPAAFWRALCDEVDAISEIPASRMDVTAYYDPRPAVPGKMMSRWGGYLEQVDQFDAGFFGISPREVERMDPQQRLLLEVAWEALEDAGQVLTPDRQQDTGVFVGLWLNDYEARLFADPAQVDFYMTTGSGRYSASGRLSYAFGLEGPSITIDTACSSSLVAVHLACRSLLSSECRMALAGGANVILQPHISIAYSQSQMLAADGRCKFGDARADGYVRSEGAGLVVLKRLSQALADGDRVYAVILGSAVNNDGRSSGFLATPAQHGQEQMLWRAYQDAGVAPSDVQYVEAHGTGTRAGDPVELGALGAVVGPGRKPGAACAVGSVKSNIGHTEGAAGVAGLIKVALMLKHQAIPASLHVQEPNPAVPWQQLGLYVPTRLTLWPKTGGRGLAGVSSFGIAGTNAHIVLQEAPPPERPQATPDTSTLHRHVLLPLSARTPAALHERAAGLRRFLDREEAAMPSMVDLGYTLALRRTQLEHRLALVAADRQDAIRQLDAYLDGTPAPGVSRSPGEADPGLKVVFVFPGQGSQWVGMGRALMEREPVFRQAVEQCEAAMRPYVTWSLVEQLSLGEESPAWRLNEIDVIQPSLLSIEIALAALWRAWGIEPVAVIGHSMGEVAAAYVAGALTLDEAMCVICRRSQLLRRTSGQGAMAVVELSLEEAQSALAGYEERLSIAVSNSPRSTVISGEPAALQEVIETLRRREVFCRPVKVDVASHSPQMEPLRAELLALLQDLRPRAGTVPIYSTALGTVVDGSTCDATYWASNLRQPVLFAKMVQVLLAAGHTTFVEMSPHPILLPAIEQGMQHAGIEGVALPSLRRDEDEQVTLLGSLGALFAAGSRVAWEQLYAGRGVCVSLPAYPWQRERFWYEPATRPQQSLRQLSGSHPLLGAHMRAATGVHLWEFELSTEAFPYLADHQVRSRVLLPASAYLEMVLAAAGEVFGQNSCSLGDVTLREALFLPETGSTVAQVVLTPAMVSTALFQVFSRPAGSENGDGWVLHAVGTIRTHQETIAPSFPAPGEMVKAHDEPVDGAAHYRAMAARELRYGPAFQTIAQLWRLAAPGHLLARLALPAPAAHEFDGYQLHPVLMDAAFQLLIAGLDDEGSAATDLLLPSSLGQFELWAQPDPSAPLWAYAVRQVNEEMLTGDVYLLGDNGQVIAAASGLTMQRLAQEPDAELEDWFYEVQWSPRELSATPAETLQATGAWLILADRGDVGSQLAVRLAALGKSPVIVYPGEAYRRLSPGRYQINPAEPDHYRRLLEEIATGQAPPLQGIVHLWGLDAVLPASAQPVLPDLLHHAQELGCMAAVHLLQALARQEAAMMPQLWLVTRASQPAGGAAHLPGMAQATLWGLGGVIANELPELRCRRVDLGPVPDQTDVDGLWAELWSGSDEDQVALRDGERYVARLAHFSAPEGVETETAVAQVEAQPGQNYEVAIPTPGVLDHLALHVLPRRSPGPGEVEIEVKAAGINFVDVMKAMGIMPGMDPDTPIALGGECAGRVVARGDGVSSLAIGDEVIAFNPAFHTSSFFRAYVTVPVEAVVRKPAQLSFEQAATIPICFLTAYYAMLHLGRLQAGERVLIHSATGGVGLAAIQLARMAKAEIFATAGTPEKREYLRQLGIEYVMDSRALRFGQEIQAQTHGQGVDMVLNSLAGEALQQSFAALGHGGRFLEIGKRDIYQNSRLGMAPFRNNVAFFAVDLARLAAERPAMVGAMLRELMGHFETGALHPLPLTAFSIGEAGEAFHRMAQAKHTGKLILTFPAQPPALTKAVEQTAAIRADATYLITGGLGGLGLTVAQWLAAEGARQLVLVGRSTPSPAAQAVVDRLQAGGVQVVVAQADVAQRSAVGNVLHQIEQTLPPLRGVFHAAGVLDDATLLQLDGEQLRRVTAPKVDGAWNLHTLTEQLPLDHFVLFSSATVLLGSPGQGNYVAANAFLDALAHHRRGLGLPGLSINWGPWAEVGLAAAFANRGERLAAQGLGSITPEQGTAALARLLRHPSAQVGVMPFDLKRWLEHMPTAARIPFFDPLKTEQKETEGKAAKAEHRAGQLRDALLATEPGRQRRALFENHLRELVARVLRLAAARVPVNKPLKSLGMDSLMALELRNRLEASLGLSLSATVVFNYPTIEQLTHHLAGRMGIALDSHSHERNGAGVEEASPVPQSDALDGLSQDEVEAMLAEELATIDDLLKGV